MRVRRWFVRKFRTRKTRHPWGKAQLTRPAWWREGCGDYSVAADSYEDAERRLTEWMDEAEATDR